jgi:hypothetical protein
MVGQKKNMVGVEYNGLMVTCTKVKTSKALNKGLAVISFPTDSYTKVIGKIIRETELELNTNHLVQSKEEFGKMINTLMNHSDFK